MPILRDQSTARLLNALQAFSENPPRDLPDGVVESIKDLSTNLAGYNGPDTASPGQREAAKVAGTDGTGEHFSKAARGVDGPSPGQIQYQRATGSQ